MPLIELARRRPSWLRIAFAGLVMAFVLSSIAHVSHRHDASVGAATDMVACGYCLTFGGLADAAVHHAPPLSSAARDERVSLPPSLPQTFRALSSSQPRAPPIS